VVFEVTRFESDAVSFREVRSHSAPSLTQLSSSYMSTTSLRSSIRGLNTHSMLIISPSGFPPLTHWKLSTLSRRPLTTLKNDSWNGASQSTLRNV